MAAINLAARFASYALIGAGGASILKNHVVEFTAVKGESMNPTLSPTFHETGQRDWLVWKKWQPTKDLKRGDLALYMSPNDPEKVVVKRVIALSGDRVQLNPKRQPGYGKLLNELRPDELAAAERWNSFGGHLIVPHGHVWVEGDNWRSSKDSNDYGPISKSLIIGRPWTAVWPAKICLTQPWENYKSKTKVSVGQDVVPQFWLE
ncbi:hypothetical protein AMS68_006310 [Peltaster fructicola]|uniref:Mitochondrial inner membrane protease subunit n=1 Tax=Peltaster fructicola TaxID=286661 RepID=A0A6H0Y1A8_9PEZI|nr:hypothetical protein AMS68_006310 [Peltaster fructicola]